MDKKVRVGVGLLVVARFLYAPAWPVLVACCAWLAFEAWLRHEAVSVSKFQGAIDELREETKDLKGLRERVLALYNRPR